MLGLAYGIVGFGFGVYSRSDLGLVATVLGRLYSLDRARERHASTPRNPPARRQGQLDGLARSEQLHLLTFPICGDLSVSTYNEIHARRAMTRAVIAVTRVVIVATVALKRSHLEVWWILLVIAASSVRFRYISVARRQRCLLLMAQQSKVNENGSCIYRKALAGNERSADAYIISSRRGRRPRWIMIILRGPG